MLGPGQEPVPQPLPDPPRASLPTTDARSSSPRVTALIEVILCSGYPTQLMLAVVLGAVGLAPVDQAGQLTLAYVVTLSLADAVILLGLIFYFLRVHHEKPMDVLLGPRPRRSEFVLGFWLIPVMVLFAVAGLSAVHAFWPWLRNVPENPMEALIQSPSDAVVFTVVAVIAGGLREELQRAFVLHRFEQHLGGGWFGLLVFSVAFGLGHYIQGWDAAIVTALLGAIWGAIYLVRRSAVSTMVSHAGFNLSEILLALSGAAALAVPPFHP